MLRENPCLIADTSISGARVARELDALMRVSGKPECIVSDNGTEITSRAILKWADKNGVPWHSIEPGKPQQNAFIESFNGSLIKQARAEHHGDDQRQLHHSSGRHHNPCKNGAVHA